MIDLDGDFMQEMKYKAKLSDFTPLFKIHHKSSNLKTNGTNKKLENEHCGKKGNFKNYDHM